MPWITSLLSTMRGRQGSMKYIYISMISEPFMPGGNLRGGLNGAGIHEVYC